MKMIENKKIEAGGFLSNETAARLVASELGVEIAKKKFHLKISIKDLVSGLNDVSLSGQVLSVYPPKTFKRKDWTDGKLASILISDESGTVRVILWDNKADLVEQINIQQEQKIRISHAYVREGQDGKPELHVGNKGNIKILSIAAKKLEEIKEPDGPLIVEGTVASTPHIREITTSQNERVKAASFRLSDSTGELNVTAWRKLAETIKDLAVGTRIRMRNIYAKKGYENPLELSSRYSTTIEVLK
jgi:replication factor A1